MTVSRVALVIPLRGPAGIFGPSCEAVVATALRTINEEGLLGEPVEVEVIDGGAEPAWVASQVAQAIDERRVDAVTGWHISAVRDAVAPVTAGRVPYLYTAIYEGGEDRTGVFCTGETPSLQIAPALRWLRDEAGVRRWVAVGNDYIWPRRSVIRTREFVDELDLRLLGVTYVPLGTSDYSAVLDTVARSDADGVLLLLVGQDAVHFNRAFAARGLDERMIRFSPLMDENVLLATGTRGVRSLYSSAAYFRSLPTAGSMDLCRDYVAHHGPDAPPLNNAAESCYEGLMALAVLTRRAGSMQLEELLRHAAGAGYDGPRGPMSLQGNHLHQRVHLAAAEGLDFDVIAAL